MFFFILLSISYPLAQLIVSDLILMIADIFAFPVLHFFLDSRSLGKSNRITSEARWGLLATIYKQVGQEGASIFVGSILPFSDNTKGCTSFLTILITC